MLMMAQLQSFLHQIPNNHFMVFYNYVELRMQHGVQEFCSQF